MNLEQSQLCVVYRSTDSLVPYKQNARTHSKRQLRQIADSIQAFGFTNPILINDDAMIVAGHGRVEAAKLLGMAEVPTIELSGLTPDQVRAYILADNKLAENAGWDESILKIELQHLAAIDLGFDITLTGFEVGEIDLILHSDEAAEEEVDLSDDGPAVCRAGDVWLLGPHRILCGDCRGEDALAILMDGEKASACFTDPPYNVVVEGNVSGHGTTHHKEFAMASGEMSDSAFTEFLAASLGALASVSEDGAVHFVAMDWRHMENVLTAGKTVYGSLLNLCVWAKDRGGLGSFYRSRHELFFVYRVGEKANRNNIQLGRFGRDRTNVWEYPPVQTKAQLDGKDNLLALHPTVKPAALVADAIQDVTARNEIVVDGFLGSGTTLVAAEQTGRRCFGMEIEPKYVDLAIRRWQQLTGGDAIHSGTGKTFGELRNEVEVTA